MKHTAITSDLFVPDILLYMTGRDKVTEIVLNTCKAIMGVKGQNLSSDTKIFKELDFSTPEIITVLLEAGNLLMVKFSFSLLLQQDEDFTIQDISDQLWKYMIRTVKNN